MASYAHYTQMTSYQTGVSEDMLYLLYLGRMYYIPSQVIPNNSNNKRTLNISHDLLTFELKIHEWTLYLKLSDIKRLLLIAFWNNI